MPSNQEDFVALFVKILQQQKALKESEAQALASKFKGYSALNFEEFLIDEGIITHESLLQALSEYYHMPAFDVRGEFFDHHLVTMFPQDLLLRHHFIPYIRDENILTLVAAEPDDPELTVLIGSYVSYDIDFLVGYFRDIEDEIEDFYAQPLTQDVVTKDQDLRQEHEEQKDEEHLEELE